MLVLLCTSKRVAIAMEFLTRLVYLGNVARRLELQILVFLSGV